MIAEYPIDNVIVIKNIAIKDFYQICKDSDNNIVVTIGMDLMARGVTFASVEKTPDALAATTLIYRPGKLMHNVGIAQTIGRITGMVRPDLTRRIYCKKEIFVNYQNYIKNQKQYMKEIKENGDIVSKEIMKNIELNNKLTRPIDRKVVGLKLKFKKETKKVEGQKLKINKKIEVIDSESNSESNSESETNRMQELIDMWYGKRTIMGKILSFVYENKNTNEEDLKKYIKECGSKNIDKMYKELIRKDKKFTNVYERKNNITNLTQEAMIYIDKIKDM